VVIVGALIGAIVLGGGLAYGYKALTSGGREGGKLPILRADSAPSKAQPTEPGGKQVAHTDKKLLNRLAEDGGPARPVPVSILPPTPDRDAGDGPRRVPTLVVNRDGTIAPPASSPSAPSHGGSGVPGLLIDGLTPRMPPPTTARVMPVEAPAPVASARRVASAPPVTVADPPAAALPAPAPAPRGGIEARRPVPTTSTRQAARTPAPAAAAAPAASVPSSGYVAVLASRQSNMDALKSLADIQQKYPGVLQGRAADVREANLGAKGIWYRVVVGPPASRQTANTVCGELKARGFGGCWIAGY
jgi:hypothetical protein